MSNPLRLLLVEDSEADAELLALELRRAGFALQFERVDSAATLAAALDRAPWDLIISDNSMPGFSGPKRSLSCVHAASIFHSSSSRAPWGKISPRAALDAGAGDALEKGNLRRLMPVIRRELGNLVNAGRAANPRRATARSCSRRRGDLSLDARGSLRFGQCRPRENSRLRFAGRAAHAGHGARRVRRSGRASPPGRA